MAEAVDYFTNHSLKLKFPWSLYHRPIVDALSSAIQASPGPRVLNIGSGPFFELQSIDRRGREFEFTICDIDPRAVELAREIHGSAITRSDVLEPDAPLPYQDGAFDLVVSMDVVEHVPHPLPWLEEAVRVIAPGGTLFLTTPNYESKSLRAIESTALEAIARVQGFSRKDLHPSKMTRRRLEDLLRKAGAGDTTIQRIALGWVLASTSRKPR